MDCICYFSAGIGRTGVLITMETAMCLIEANQAVYPLDIVQQMREQRAMLIQTSVSEALFRSVMGMLLSDFWKQKEIYYLLTSDGMIELLP